MKEILLKLAERVSVEDIIVYVVILALVFIVYVLVSVIVKLVKDIGEIGTEIRSLSENLARVAELMRILVVGKIKENSDNEE